MKKLIYILLFLLSSQIASAQYPVTIGTVRYIADVADGTDITSSIETVVSASSDDDVIVLPQGKFVITGQILIDAKDISVIGHGADSITGTMLYRLRSDEVDDDPMFYWSNASPVVNASYYFISGVYFKGVPGTLYGGVAIGATYHTGGVKVQRATNFMVTDNIFQYIGMSAIEIRPVDSLLVFGGLVFNNNTIDSYQEELDNIGYGVLVLATFAETHTWISDPVFGGDQFVFIEDNYFSKTRHAVAAGVAGKYVFRYNTIQDNWRSTAIDMHGAGLFGNDLSTRAAEIYSNTISSNIDNNGDAIIEGTAHGDYGVAIGIRGGEALIYDNIITNYKYGTRFVIEDTTYGDPPDEYPAPYQIGYLSAVMYGAGDTGYATDHGDGDNFVWDNDFEEKLPEFTEFLIWTEHQSWLQFNRDIHEVEKPSYTPYTYPHPYRNYYYTFVDNWFDSAAIVGTSNIASTSALLSWEDVLLDNGYNIYLSTDEETFTLEDSVTLNVTSITLSELSIDTDYWAYVRAKNDTHLGETSDTISFSTVGTISPIQFNGNTVRQDGVNKTVIIIR